MPTFIRISFVCFVSLISICLEQVVIACGGGEDPFDSYLSFFHNNTAGTAAYLPFYYISGYEYYEDWEGPMATNLDNDKNLEEWLAYGDHQFRAEDAASFIYKYSYEDLSNIYYHIERHTPLQIADSVKNNQLTQWFLKKKDLEALGYLMYAKKCANHAIQNTWDVTNPNQQAMAGLVKNGRQLHRAATGEFFRWRYAYQIMRMAFYSGNCQQTLELWDELIGEKTASNIMYFRCLSLKAGCLYRLQEYDKAAFLYAKAFYGTDDNKLSNYISYTWCFKAHDSGLSASTGNTFALAATKQEKAMLQVMDALHDYNNGLALMTTAYKTDHNVKGLEVVMTREINKIEQTFLTPLLRSKRGFNDYYYPYNNYYQGGAYWTRQLKEMEQSEQQLNKLIAFAQEVYTEDKRHTEELAFWPLSVAYLYFMKEDWQNCRQWLAHAETSQPRGRIAEMLLLERLLLEITEHPRLDASAEARILPSLNWLEGKALHNTKYAATYRNVLTSVLANTYMKQQDTIKALLCIARGSIGPEGKGINAAYYNSAPAKPQHVDPGHSVEMEQVTTSRLIELRDWMKDKKKSPFEQWLIQSPPYQEGAINMYLATRYIRQFDFDEAVKLLEKVPASVLIQWPLPDPFAERWIDTQEPKEELATYNKLDFSREMQRLQSGIKKTSAENLYRYANGLYSMTYYGLAWKAAMYYRSGVDMLAYYNDSNRSALLPEYRNYYSAQEAARYFQLAYDKTNDKALKAKCLFMLSKCWQKTCPMPREYVYRPWDDDTYFRYSITSPYFNLLSKYSDQPVFKTISEECAYLRSYMNRISK